jgi:ankyrin repeat protein
MYACAGGHEEVVRTLLDAGANVEDHNENGHTPLMEAASAGHVGVAKVLYIRSFLITPPVMMFSLAVIQGACKNVNLTGKILCTVSARLTVTNSGALQFNMGCKQWCCMAFSSLSFPPVHKSSDNICGAGRRGLRELSAGNALPCYRSPGSSVL